MRKKVTVGLLLAAAMLVIIYFGSGPLFVTLLFGAGMGMWEYYRLLRLKKVKPMVFLGIGFGLAFIVLAYCGRWWDSFSYGMSSVGTVISVYVFSILVIQFSQIVTRKERYSILDLAATVFGSLYIGMFASFLVLIMNVADAQFPDSMFANRVLILLPMWAAWGSDAGAYFAGSYFGKNRIFPELSPKKTLEGCVGGMLASMLGFGMASFFVKIPFFHALLLGIIASAFGQVGDLSESAFKRELNIKDSSTVFASHGGFLDRIDSVLFTFPVVYMYIDWVRPWG